MSPTNLRTLLAFAQVMLLACIPPKRPTLSETEVWNQCLYIHQGTTVTAMRRCLVGEHQWTPTQAERRISLFRDSVARDWDSLYRSLPGDTVFAKLEAQFPAVYGPMAAEIHRKLVSDAVNRVLAD